MRAITIRPILALSAALVLALATGVPVSAEENGGKPATRDEMRGKLRKKRAERRKNGGTASPAADESSAPAPGSETKPSAPVSDEVSSSQVSPRTRHFALLAHAGEISAAAIETESATDGAADDEGDRSLLDAVLGFESEIEPNDPRTRAGIEKAQVKSGLRSAPATPEEESIEWESAPTSLE